MNISIADIATLLTITLVAVGFISWLTRRWINELIEKQVQPQLDSDSESMRLAGLVAEHSRDAALAAQQAALEARDAARDAALSAERLGLTFEKWSLSQMRQVQDE